MACERRLDAHAGRLMISNLTDHDDVRVLAKHGSQRSNEGQPDPLVYLDLVDERQLIFHGIFDRNDVRGFATEQIKRRVEGGGLSTSGGTGHEHQTIGAVDHRGDGGAIRVIDAQRFELEAQAFLVENSDDDFFAQYGRHGGDAQVDFPPVRDDVNATFLGKALFRNVHLPDHLDPGDDGRVHALGRFEHFTELSVDAVADMRRIAIGFDMNIAGACAEGVENGHVDQVYDRAALDHLIEIGDRPLVDRFRFRDMNVGLFHRSKEGVDADFVGEIFSLKLTEILLEYQDGADGTARQAPKPVLNRQGLGLGHRNGQFAVHSEQRQDVQSFRFFLGHALGHLGVDQPVAKDGAFYVKPLRQRLDQGRGGHRPGIHQRGADPPAGCLLPGEGFGKLLRGDQPVAYELFTQSGCAL